MNWFCLRIVGLYAGILLAANVFAAAAENPASLALEHFRRGANFGNYLEVPPEQNWALTYTLDDIKNVKKEGFDHIRLPIGWHHYAGPGPAFKLSPVIFQKVDFIVTNSLNEGLAVIINIHHFDALRLIRMRIRRNSSRSGVKLPNITSRAGENLRLSC